MRIEDFVSRLEGVTRCGENQYKCKCPAHNDSNPSLSVGLGDDGRILLYCFAGCKPEQICDSMGLKMSDIMAENTFTNSRCGLTLEEYAECKRFNIRFLQEFGLETGEMQYKNTLSKVLKIPYYDQNGNLFRYKIRHTMQNIIHGFERFSWDGGTGKGVCLYGLWRQPANRDYVILVEGESDTHALSFCGYPVLGVPGASNYKPNRDDPILLQYSRIYVHIERDNGGVTLFNSIAGRNGSTAIGQMSFFSIPGYKDPSELWKALYDKNNGNIEEAKKQFLASIGNALESAQKAETFDVSAYAKTATKENKKSDRRAVTSAQNGLKGGRPEADPRGLAREIYTECEAKGKRIIYANGGCWYVFANGIYKEYLDTDFETLINRKIGESIDNGNPYNLKSSVNAKNNVVNELKSFCSKFINGMFLYGENRWINELSSDKRQFVVLGNGILDVDTAADYTYRENPNLSACIYPYTMDFFTTGKNEYSFVPGATCPKFMQFLEEIMPSQENRDVIRRIFGLLFGKMMVQRFFLFEGEGGCGKSTLLQILMALIGDDNYSTLTLQDLDPKNGRFKVYLLATKRANICDDFSMDNDSASMRIIPGQLKYYTGGNAMIQCERKGKDIHNAPCVSRLVFACNDIPHLLDSTSALTDRLVDIHFTQRFRNTGREKRNIAQEIIAEEMSGILNWALYGLGELQNADNPESLLTSTQIKQRVLEYRKKTDPSLAFITKRLKKHEEFSCAVKCMPLFRKYQDFMTARGYKPPCIGKMVEKIEAQFGIIPTEDTYGEEFYGGMTYISTPGETDDVNFTIKNKGDM